MVDFYKFGRSDVSIFTQNRTIFSFEFMMINRDPAETRPDR